MKTISAIFWIIADKALSGLYADVMGEGLYWEWLDSLQAQTFKRRYSAVRKIKKGE